MEGFFISFFNKMGLRTKRPISDLAKERKEGSPLNSSVMVLIFNTPGTDTTRYTLNNVSHQRITDGAPALIARLSSKGITLGRQERVRRGRGKSDSIALSDLI